MENEKEERPLTEEDESIKIPEKGSSKYFRLFLFSFVLFLFAYWLGANQSENDTLFGQIREKALACIGKVTVVSGNDTREEEIENSVLDASILDMEDPTEKIALETQVQSQDNTQITQNACIYICIQRLFLNHTWAFIKKVFLFFWTSKMCGSLLKNQMIKRPNTLFLMQAFIKQ